MLSLVAVNGSFFLFEMKIELPNIFASKVKFGTNFKFSFEYEYQVGNKKCFSVFQS